MDVISLFQKKNRKKGTIPPGTKTQETLELEKKARKRTRHLKKEYMTYISTFMRNEYINLNEFTLLVEFVKKDGNLVELERFHSIIKKIILKKDENIVKFIKICNRIFSHIYTPLNNPLYNFTDINNLNITLKRVDYKALGNSMIKDNSELTFTKDQTTGIYNLMRFITSPLKYTYGLYGFAGTGKTTTIIQFIAYLLKNKLITSICLTAPTNKAVNVMKSKFRYGLKQLIQDNITEDKNKDTFAAQLEELNKNGLKVDFITIHKLLNYKNEYNATGERIFVKGLKSNIMKYDLVIIDECSMISMQIIADIFEDIQKRIREQGTNNEYKNIPKILFVGDPAQLPPVNEENSIIFSKQKKDFNIQKFIESVEDKYCTEFTKNKMERIQNRIDNLEEAILAQQYTTLKKVMRTKNDNVINLCNNIRNWVTGVIKQPTIFEFVGKGVYLYKYDKLGKKDTEWLNKYIKMCKKQEETGCTNIILTWTNRQTNQYNDVVRKSILNKKNLNKFEVGDYLIFKDFYNFDECASTTKKSDEKKRFYTSEQIKITDLELVMKVCDLFSSKYPEKARKIQYGQHIEKEYTQLINMINKQTKRTFKSYKMHIQRVAEISSNSIPETYILYVLYESSKIIWEDEKDFVSQAIRTFRNKCKKTYSEQINHIDRLLMGNLWKQFNKVFIDTFADVDYSHSISTHRSQGSNYGNVYVDVDDILKNKNDTEVKRCLYTAFTRTAEELHLLI